VLSERDTTNKLRTMYGKHIQSTNIPSTNVSSVNIPSINIPSTKHELEQQNSGEIHQLPTMYVLTTGVRKIDALSAFETTTVKGQRQTNSVAQIYDEGYGPRQWPEGAKRVVDGHVTVWRKIAAECPGWCFVSEDDAIWPNGIPSELPSEGFVSFFKEAVCGQAKGVYSENYDSVVKVVVPGKCMPYGAVAYAITGDFAKILLSKLPMSKPVDHFLWEQAVVQQQAYVSRRYVVQHKKGKSLRQNTVQPPPPNADIPDTTRPNHIGAKSSKSRPKIAVHTHNHAGVPINDSHQLVSNSLPVCVLILACDRPKELNIALTSWSKLSGLPVTISMDCESHESDVVVADWLGKQPLWSKMDSFQRLIKEPPSEETITRHWVSALTIMFQRPECDYVIYAEEDHIVSDDFFDSAKTLISAFDTCPTCWSMNMGCHRDCWGKRENNPSAVIRMESGNMGVIYTREGFQTFMNHIDTFCDMLGNWDNNVHTMAAIGHIKPHSLTFLQPRIHHLSTCHSSRTGVTHNRNCDWSKETVDFFSKERRLHEPLVDRGVALFRPGAKTYARAPALTKQRCLAAASALDSGGNKTNPVPSVAVILDDPVLSDTGAKTTTQAIHVNGGTDRIKCDVPCFWPTTGGSVVRTIHIDELKTTMTMSMEGEGYYPSLQLSNRKKNHAIASTRFDSDIPIPYYNWPWTLYMDETPQEKDKWSRNYIQTPPIKFANVKKAAVFIARNCGSRSNREALVQSLMKWMPVDSVSSCLHNFDFPDTSKKGPVMQKYAMYFAFENQRIDDYITEKLWGTFSAGVLPVYFGAPNIKEHVPEHSIVHVDDFASHEELAQHLKDIMSNEELYNSYHAWRYKPLPTWFVHKYNFTHVHSACRTCRWASAQLRGLPWDAAQQQIAAVAPAAVAPATVAPLEPVAIPTYKADEHTLTQKNPEYVQGTGISDEYGTESAKHKKGRRQSVTLSTITEFGRECQKVYSGIGPDSLCNGIVPIDNPYMKSIGHGLNLSGSGRAFLSKPMRFSDFEFSCYSQTTEDGVLLSILESIGVTNRRAVEIAGGVGWENNLANLVINFGFETLFFDGDPGNVRCARNFFDHHPSTRHHPPVFADDFVSAENINSLIKSKGWSGPIDVFSLDIDGVDYWIWDAIEIIQPRVVVVEIQELWGPEERWTRPYNSNFHSDGIPSMGASLAAFDYLARKKGYRLVGCVKAGFNAFFVSESAANLDDIFGSGSYDRSGCFAHVDQHWRTVLDNRREKASKYSWVDPKTGKYLSNSNTVTDPKIAVAIPTYKADEHALTQKYVVVMPSVKRNNDIYLKKTLASLEVAKPSEITVILVNGHQPPEHHSYLNDWCASHESYKCIVPPPVPDSLIEDVVSNDKRHDTVEYLRWRTTEAIHAMFGMKEFLKTGGEYMVWLQDDVTIEKDLFLSLPDEEIICLRSDGYCGMVAYMFKRSFVQQLLPRLEIDFKDMPIDWILDNVWGKDVVRIPKAYHHGFISSNGKIRHKTKNEASKASKSRPKIAVAIPTYNRAGYVQLCAAALSKTIPSNDVWIFDDHSTEYTAGDLQKWFGSHSVQRNAKRFKADKQARHILEWFVGTDYDWLVTLDSDLIVRPDWLELLRGMLPHTQGVMSLYHSGNPNHPTLHCDPHLCEMKSLGNAGVAWSKVLAKRMLVEMTQSDGFDWGWTEWLRKQKIPQYAAKDSLVLHVGMHGTWGADSKREKSVGFPMDKLSPDVRGRAELFLKGM